MKKALSVFLAIFMIFAACTPVFAATSCQVNFVNTVDGSDWYHGYAFVNSVDGKMQYIPDENGIYVYYAKGGRYTTWDNLFDYNKPANPEWHSPQVLVKAVVNAGEEIKFQLWSMEYNLATAYVTANGEQILPDENGEYTVTVTANTEIKIVEKDANGSMTLQQNHYEIQLASGEGFKCKPQQGQNYRYVYYEGDFYFRVKIDEGYTGSGMSVSVLRGYDVLAEYLEEDADLILDVLEKTEPLTSYGVDSEGYRLYKISDITADCRIIVSGVEAEEEEGGIMGLLMRILRLLLNLFGIELDILDDLTAYYNVSVVNSNENIAYEVYLGSEDYTEKGAFTVSGGAGLVVKVIKESLDENVKVTWTPGNADGSYQTQWLPEYDEDGNVVYTALYYVDNIGADTAVVIS